MNERQFQAWIIEVAERFGWRCWHVGAPMRPIGGNKFVPEPRARGLPDLFLLHDDPPRLIFAEVKGEKGTLSVEQQEFLRLARQVAEWSNELEPGAQGIAVGSKTIGVYVWQPGMEQAIEDALRSKVLG